MHISHTNQEEASDEISNVGIKMIMTRSLSPKCSSYFDELNSFLELELAKHTRSDH
jgi:hypothetical protein